MNPLSLTLSNQYVLHWYPAKDNRDNSWDAQIGVMYIIRWNDMNP